MATVTIPWSTGGGNITLTFTGQGNGTVIVSSDDNPLDVSRSQAITVKTTDNSVSRTVTITQAAGTNFRTSEGKRVKLSNNLYFNVKDTNNNGNV